MSIEWRGEADMLGHVKQLFTFARLEILNCQNQNLLRFLIQSPRYGAKYVLSHPSVKPFGFIV